MTIEASADCDPLQKWQIDWKPHEPLESRWEVLGAYLSPVTFAVHLRPADRQPTDDVLQAAQHDLKVAAITMLHAALEAGFLLPITVVVEIDGSTADQVANWSRDQDWHRGEFLLFVADSSDRPNGARHRLLDLLAPMPINLKSMEFRARTDEDVLKFIYPKLSPDLQLALTLTHESFQTARVAVNQIGERFKRRGHDDIKRQCNATLTKWWRRRCDGASEKTVETEVPQTHEPVSQRSNPDPLHSPSPHIRRVNSLAIRNFRGFVHTEDPECEHDLPSSAFLNTDADIVLIAAPNGNGKTSFLEALLLILTGAQLHPSNDSLSLLDTPTNSSADAPRAQRFRISAEVAWQSDDSKKTELGVVDCTSAFPSDRPGIAFEARRLSDDPPRRLDWPVSLSRWRQQDTTVPPDTELDGRICAFFQDDTHRLFDEASSGLTVRDLFEPVPPFVAALLDAAREVISEIQQEAEKRIGQSNFDANQREQIERDLRPWLEQFGHAYAELVKYWPTVTVGDGQTLKPMPIFEVNFDSLLQVCSAVLSESGASPSTVHEPVSKSLMIIQEQFRNLSTKFEQPDMRGKQRDELRVIKEKIAKIERDFPHLDEEILYFAVPDENQPPDRRRMLDSLLRELEQHASLWARRARQTADKHGLLQEIAVELEACLPIVAGQRACELEAWLCPRREAFEQLSRLRDESLQLERKLGQFQPDTAFEVWREKTSRLVDSKAIVLRMCELRSWQADEPRRQAESTRLRQAETDLKELIKLVQEDTSPSEKLRDTLTNAINAVLGRFAMTPGLDRIDLVATDQGNRERQIYRPRGAGGDGRGLKELSTGQRAQVGVAVMVAQNEMAHESQYRPGHSIVILDDVSTSYDLSNLSREALLWRQLAYHPDPRRRRQLFIASHHEDLTNHLLDLLAPPGHGGQDDGADQPSMRLLRFDGWNRQTGPDVKQYIVAESPQRDAAQIAGRTLVDLLKRSYR